MSTYLNVLWKVGYIFVLGLAPLLPVLFVEWLLGTSFLYDGVTSVFANRYSLVVIGLGCMAIALAIYDGQFGLDSVKSSHYWHKQNGMQ